ncbi:MAG: TolC family protein, partial [Proteobacteria bacterium]
MLERKDYLSLVILACFTSGCSGIVLDNEYNARKKFAEVSEEYRPNGQRPALPELHADSTLQELLTFGILNDPAVEAAYYDWQASIERITTARSLPDPKLTFEADIADTVMSLMSGFMFDLPGAGKLSAMGDMASAESQSKFYAFKLAVLNTAAAIRNAYFSLQALESSIVVNNRGLELLRDLEDIARAQHETGKVTLQDVLRAEIEREKLLTENQNFADSRLALQAALKGTLGIDPRTELTIPKVFTNSTGEIAHEEILTRAFERNPLLKKMEAEIGKAEAALRLARLSVVPDFGIGLRADVKPNPAIFNPEFSITLPIWRDKIAAQIGAAQADSNAARSRLSREQINLAVDFASMLYM